MHLIIYYTLLILPSALIILFYHFTVKQSRELLPKEWEWLDRVGAVTNVLLALLYLPVSIIGSFSGMVGESFIACGTALQQALCELIGILGFSTPVAAYGGLVVSVKLRNRGLSLRSFFYQFSGIIYLLFLWGLSAIPFYL